MAKQKTRSTARKRQLGEGVARIALIDDHALLRRGLAELINSEDDLEVCGEAADPSSALELIEREQPDLSVVDISLQEGSGLELIKQIKSQHPDVDVIVLSMHDENLYAERTLRAGAKGYVNKEAAADTVIKAIREVLAGRVYLSDRMSDRILHRIVDRDAMPEESPIDTLSDRELEVLELIGRGLTTRQIARQLHLSRKTIDTYRDHLKTKLQLNTANELVRYAVAWTLGKEDPAT